MRGSKDSWSIVSPCSQRLNVRDQGSRILTPQIILLLTRETQVCFYENYELFLQKALWQIHIDILLLLIAIFPLHCRQPGPDLTMLSLEKLEECSQMMFKCLKKYY